MTQVCEMVVGHRYDAAVDAIVGEIYCTNPAVEHLGCWVCAGCAEALEAEEPEMVAKYRQENARAVP